MCQETVTCMCVYFKNQLYTDRHQWREELTGGRLRLFLRDRNWGLSVIVVYRGGRGFGDWMGR